MGIRKIPQTEISYGLISFDKQGVERTDDPDGRMSDALIQLARAQPFTNVLLFSHGWKGDVPAAVDQYDRWIKAFDDVVDRTQAAQAFPGFRPLYIGLHWPSQPWGDEELVAVPRASALLQEGPGTACSRPTSIGSATPPPSARR